MPTTEEMSDALAEAIGIPGDNIIYSLRSNLLALKLRDVQGLFLESHASDEDIVRAAYRDIDTIRKFWRK